MQLFGFTLNLLTLLAIVLSVGLVVDDAIVVVENVERHMREGMSRMNAALVGARELIGPIIAMTITLAAVYTPIALQGGLTGALFREFALTLAGAVFISGIVALVFSPMMSAHLLRQSMSIMDLAAWSIARSIASAIGMGVTSTRTLECAAGCLYRLGRRLALGALHVVAYPCRDERIGSQGRSERDLRHHHRAGQCHDRRHDSLCRCRRQNFSKIFPIRVLLFK